MEIDIKILREAFDVFGEEKQMKMVEEECLELATAIIKHQRNPSEKTEEDLIDEFADVFIVVNYGPMFIDPQKIQERINFKLERLRLRVASRQFNPSCILKSKES